MEKREPYLIVVCGKKGIGKTYTTTQIIDAYIKGNPSKGVKPRRALIIDINGEFGKYKTIPLSKIAEFSRSKTIEARRLTVFKNDGTKMNLDEIALMLYYVLDNYKNGLLLVEDVTRYIADGLSKDVIGALCMVRHTGIDVILHFQLLGKAGHPKILGNINMLRLHRVTDSVDRHKNKFEDYCQIMKIAQIMVNKEYEKENKSIYYSKKDHQVYFYVTINFNNDTIFGNFSKQLFIEAIEEYIESNPSETVTNYLKKRNRQGKAIYNYEGAYNKVLDDLTKKYYGNPK